MQQQLLLAVGAAALAVFNEDWGTLWCLIAALCRRSGPAGYGQYSTRNEREDEDLGKFSVTQRSRMCGCSVADEGTACCALPGCEGFRLLCHHCSSISPTFCLWDKTHDFLREQVVLGVLFNLPTGKCSPKRVCHKKYYSFSSLSFPRLGNLHQQHLASLLDFLKFDFYTDGSVFL